MVPVFQTEATPDIMATQLSLDGIPVAAKATK